jgi:hypothetical protein
MKWLFVPLLWALAALVTVAVLWRLYRGKNIVLRGKWSPRLIRIVAIILVVLGVGVTKSPAAAPVTSPADKNKTDAKSDDLPATITSATIRQWLTSQTGEWGRGETIWPRFKLAMTHSLLTTPSEREMTQLKKFGQGQPPKLAAMFKADLEALAAKKEPPRLDAKSSIVIYDEIESRGYYDHWLNAYLWRKTASADAAEMNEMAEVYARMYRHSRMTDALIRAFGEVKPYTVSARAWMSKGGPRPEERNLEEKGLADMQDAAKKLFPAIDGGTWKRDGIAILTIVKDSPTPTLLRAGRRQPLPSGEMIRFGRLDLIETPLGDESVLLEHAWLGRITLPANRTISVWQLSGLLRDEGQKKLRKTVQDALEGDEDAADKLELVLPLAHSAIRDGLTRLPKAKLAPRLRMMLSLFDDAVMPTLLQRSVSDFPIGSGSGQGGVER